MEAGKDVGQLVKRTMLYDFYGELLTEHQRRVYEDVVWNDFSLTEIAEDEGISRQAVSDLVKRINKLLDGYEARLHLVERFDKVKKKVKMISDKTKELKEECRKSDSSTDILDDRFDDIKKLADSILEDF